MLKSNFHYLATVDSPVTTRLVYNLLTDYDCTKPLKIAGSLCLFPELINTNFEFSFGPAVHDIIIQKYLWLYITILSK